MGPGGRAGFGGPGGGRFSGGQDLTSGPIAKTMFMFMLPVLGTNVLQSLNGTVNLFWVSHALGESAMAAVSNANIIMMLLMGAIFGVSMASNILVAQAVGMQNFPLIKRVMGTAMTFFFVLSVGLGVFGTLFSPQILDAMGTPPEARALAIDYLRVVFATTPFMYFFMFFQMAQRGAGDSTTPFYFTLVAITVGLILNPLLINGYWGFPKLGIVGSALSTFFGQLISLVLLVGYMHRTHSILLLRPNELHLLRPDTEIIKMLVFRGLPMGFQMFVMSGAALVMMGFVNAHGTIVTAAYAVSSQIWTYVQMPAMALGASVSSMAGQNIGAGKWDRVDRVAWTGVLMGLGVTGAVAALIYLSGDLVLRPFMQADSPALPIAHHINLIVLWGFVVFAVNFTLSGIVRATGSVWPPLIILIVSMWIIRVPFAAFLQPYWGADAIWWSFPFGTITSALLSAAYYKWGNWRESRLMPMGAMGQAPVDLGGEVSDTGLSKPIMDEEPLVIAGQQTAATQPPPSGPSAAWGAVGTDFQTFGRSLGHAVSETFQHVFGGSKKT
jgi:putative MATE family efflux protein